MKAIKCILFVITFIADMIILMALPSAIEQMPFLLVFFYLGICIVASWSIYSWIGYDQIKEWMDKFNSWFDGNDHDKMDHAF